MAEGSGNGTGIVIGGAAGKDLLQGANVPGTVRADKERDVARTEVISSIAHYIEATVPADPSVNVRELSERLVACFDTCIGPDQILKGVKNLLGLAKCWTLESLDQASKFLRSQPDKQSTLALLSCFPAFSNYYYLGIIINPALLEIAFPVLVGLAASGASKCPDLVRKFAKSLETAGQEGADMVALMS